MHKAHKAARAVAALFDFTAIGIENTVAEIGIRPRGLFDDQNLVAADAEMPVGDEPRLWRPWHESLVDGVEHDKVIARALHFGKADFHEGDGSRSGRWQSAELAMISPFNKTAARPADVF